ncbi:hypothetical protein V502_03127, partial [Pseudogymnoascus sp. VKM F-4520 (FW-2644)]
MEKAEALRSEVLGRFDAKDDLEQDPLADWDGTGHLQWNQAVSLEEVERNTIGVSSTSPGTDQVTMPRPQPLPPTLEACRGYYDPEDWQEGQNIHVLPGLRLPQVSSLHNTVVHFSKGLERTIARRVAWTALTSGILSSQHGGALPKRSAMDLVAAFTHEIETAFTTRQHATMITMDVQGAFDALLANRLLARMTKQGWPLPLLRLVQSFLT